MTSILYEHNDESSLIKKKTWMECIQIFQSIPQPTTVVEVQNGFSFSYSNIKIDKSADIYFWVEFLSKFEIYY